MNKFEIVLPDDEPVPQSASAEEPRRVEGLLRHLLEDICWSLDLWAYTLPPAYEQLCLASLRRAHREVLSYLVSFAKNNPDCLGDDDA